MARQIIQINNLPLGEPLNEFVDNTIFKDDSSPFIYTHGNYEPKRGRDRLVKEKNINQSFLLSLVDIPQDKRSSYVKAVRREITKTGMVYLLDIDGKVLEAEYSLESKAEKPYPNTDKYLRIDLEVKIKKGYFRPVDKFNTFIDLSQCRYVECSACKYLDCNTRLTATNYTCPNCDTCTPCTSSPNTYPSMCEFNDVINECGKFRLIRDTVEGALRYPDTGNVSARFGRGITLNGLNTGVTICHDSIVATTGTITLTGPYVDPSITTSSGTVSLTGFYNGVLVFDGTNNIITYNGVYVPPPILSPVPMLRFDIPAEFVLISGAYPGAAAYYKVEEIII